LVAAIVSIIFGLYNVWAVLRIKVRKGDDLQDEELADLKNNDAAQE
jgi:hypothetical protein